MNGIVASVSVFPYKWTIFHTNPVRAWQTLQFRSWEGPVPSLDRPALSDQPCAREIGAMFDLSIGSGAERLSGARYRQDIAVILLFKRHAKSRWT